MKYYLIYRLKHQKEELTIDQVVERAKRSFEGLIIHPADIRIGHTLFTDIICAPENDIFDHEKYGKVYKF